MSAAKITRHRGVTIAAVKIVRYEVRNAAGKVRKTYAKRAVTGGWEQSGKETLAQKRGGLTPETPVRDADKPGGH